MKVDRERIFAVCNALHAIAPPQPPDNVPGGDVSLEYERLRAMPCLGVTVWSLVLELYHWRGDNGDHSEYATAFRSLISAVLGEFGE